mmetsp:Transcript_95357/g.307763  ORF Transcript_95357/g.307763 Transcript_95357/m.307763 type:complete len:326 (+) Transcript_95357:121-1098(+)
MACVTSVAKVRLAPPGALSGCHFSKSRRRRAGRSSGLQRRSSVHSSSAMPRITASREGSSICFRLPLAAAAAGAAPPPFRTPPQATTWRFSFRTFRTQPGSSPSRCTAQRPSDVAGPTQRPKAPLSSAEACKLCRRTTTPRRTRAAAPLRPGLLHSGPFGGLLPDDLPPCLPPRPPFWVPGRALLAVPGEAHAPASVAALPLCGVGPVPTPRALPLASPDGVPCSLPPPSPSPHAVPSPVAAQVPSAVPPRAPSSAPPRAPLSAAPSASPDWATRSGQSQPPSWPQRWPLAWPQPCSLAWSSVLGERCAQPPPLPRLPVAASTEP